MPVCVARLIESPPLHSPHHVCCLWQVMSIDAEAFDRVCSSIKDKLLSRAEAQYVRTDTVEVGDLPGDGPTGETSLAEAEPGEHLTPDGNAGKSPTSADDRPRGRRSSRLSSLAIATARQQEKNKKKSVSKPKDEGDDTEICVPEVGWMLAPEPRVLFRPPNLLTAVPRKSAVKSRLENPTGTDGGTSDSANQSWKTVAFNTDTLLPNEQ
eukprot:GHVQ01004908.1.p1 GENE.GHVQ01004908.1~~GHVQ01004908.1.p1  ORF type:complete len:210 (+),score=36.76 GHVQ01004908.1:1248-1877(+)